MPALATVRRTASNILLNKTVPALAGIFIDFCDILSYNNPVPKGTET